MYLYRAVDSAGDTVEFILSPSRDAQSAKRFFRKALRAKHTVMPRVINVDKNPAYPKAVDKLKGKGTLPPRCKLRPFKYLNNLIEQERPTTGLSNTKTAGKTPVKAESKTIRHPFPGDL
jgi:transposase, IS6 family